MLSTFWCQSVGDDTYLVALIFFFFFGKKKDDEQEQTTHVCRVEDCAEKNHNYRLV